MMILGNYHAVLRELLLTKNRPVPYCGRLHESVVKRHFLSGANGRLESVAFESNGILYSQAAGC